jgi:hypothetical protein
VPTYVRTGFYVCRIIKKPLLLLRIRNHQSDRLEIFKGARYYPFTAPLEISGRLDRWFLILSNSKLIASVSFQSTSTGTNPDATFMILTSPRVASVLFRANSRGEEIILFRLRGTKHDGCLRGTKHNGCSSSYWFCCRGHGFQKAFLPSESAKVLLRQRYSSSGLSMDLEDYS